ncbi:phage tail protein [Paenibacillus crassostreae]|uniref:Uncharacterized protein n=1 Tax=Paenibacillus crassostreae TaxID=1763538 RepID=A0A162KRL6_9BACL|nr:phage tail protein [Paenibacillus crassostreae]AOZ91623.1 hypothetical protein LPB68_04920 [Paenibacillus crassostreae]OAB72803.1 hypothetical protein PNBC_15330 [Paenibacillus crassostreae]
MMAIASFQGKIFMVSSTKVYTLDGLEWSGSLNTESQEKLKSKPSTYIKGQALNTMSFDIPLRADMKTDVRKQIEAWEAIRDKQSPGFFVLGTKPLGKNKWLLKSVATSDTVIDNKGTIISAKINLSFEEYVRAGSAQAAKAASNSSGSSRTSISSSGGAKLNVVPTTYIDKPTAKRTNINVAQARLNASEARIYSMGG